MNEKCYAVLTAGGESSGPGSPYIAQLMEDADGRPIYLYTVEALAGSGLFEEIILYVPAGIAPAVKRRLAEALPDAPVTVLAGNPSQLEAALQTADRIPDAPDTVLVLHDLLRPFVTDRILQEAAETARRSGVCDTAVPSADTLFVSGNGEDIDRIPDRQNLYQEQAPQAVRADLLKKHAEAAGKSGAADVCSALHGLGVQIFLVRGEAANIRIASPAERRAARALLEEG